MKTIKVQVSDSAYQALMRCVSAKFGASPSAIVTGLVECLCDPKSITYAFDLSSEIKQTLMSCTLESLEQTLTQIKASTMFPVIVENKQTQP